MKEKLDGAMCGETYFMHLVSSITLNKDILSDLILFLTGIAAVVYPIATEIVSRHNDRYQSNFINSYVQDDLQMKPNLIGLLIIFIVTVASKLFEPWLSDITAGWKNIALISFLLVTAYICCRIYEFMKNIFDFLADSENKIINDLIKICQDGSLPKTDCIDAIFLVLKYLLLNSFNAKEVEKTLQKITTELNGEIEFKKFYTRASCWLFELALKNENLEPAKFILKYFFDELIEGKGLQQLPSTDQSNLMRLALANLRDILIVIIRKSPVSFASVSEKIPDVNITDYLRRLKKLENKNCIQLSQLSDLFKEIFLVAVDAKQIEIMGYIARNIMNDLSIKKYRHRQTIEQCSDSARKKEKLNNLISAEMNLIGNISEMLNKALLGEPESTRDICATLAFEKYLAIYARQVKITQVLQVLTFSNFSKIIRNDRGDILNVFLWHINLNVHRHENTNLPKLQELILMICADALKQNKLSYMYEIFSYKHRGRKIDASTLFDPLPRTPTSLCNCYVNACKSASQAQLDLTDSVGFEYYFDQIFLLYLLLIIENTENNLTTEGITDVDHCLKRKIPLLLDRLQGLFSDRQMGWQLIKLQLVGNLIDINPEHELYKKAEALLNQIQTIL